MGLFDTILGRSKPVRANLDALFALPPAAVTLQVTCGVLSTGHAGVCFKPPAGQPFADMQAELEQLLATPDDDAGAAPAPAVRHVGDRFGYRWILVDADAVDDLVTRVHMVHSSLQDAGWGTQLLCSVFGFAPSAAATSASSAGSAPGAAGDVSDPVGQKVYVVYLAKQGTFYPFAPSGDEKRDNELELRLRSILSADLPIEDDLARWFAIWDLPVE